MTKLSKNHPFILTASRLEFLEAEIGLTDEIIEERIKLKEKYPEYFAEYMKAKNIKQEEKLYRGKIEKEKQIKKTGGETVSYHKMKAEEQKRKNRLAKNPEKSLGKIIKFLK